MPAQEENPHSPMILFYDKGCSWEFDYITKTILNNVSFELCRLSSSEMRNVDFFKELNRSRKFRGNCIYVFGSHVDRTISNPLIKLIKKENFLANHDKWRLNDNIIKLYQRTFQYNKICSSHPVFRVVKFIQPKIVINLSDEAGTRPYFNYLSNFTDLYIREYHHIHYPLNDKAIHIPLGYMNKMFDEDFKSSDIVASSKRKYKWSFIGNLKQDRTCMLNTFKCLKPNLFKPCNVEEMKNIYCNSIFVPNGRGGTTLDCLRLYEASLCGAIPIVVGTDIEIKNTFGAYQDPPFVYSNNWSDALNRCENLLRDPSKLDERQKQIAAWWDNYINIIQNKIRRLSHP